MELILPSGDVCLIDNEDYIKIHRKYWYITKAKYTKYVRSNIHLGMNKYKTVLIHRIIIGAKKGEIVDHINGNGLDNRKSNLRIVTNRQNSQNRHNNKGVCKSPGVTYHKNRGKYQAQIYAEKRHIYLGFYDAEEEAFEAYKNKLVEIGESILYDSE